MAMKTYKKNDLVGLWTVITVTDSTISLRCQCGAERTGSLRLFANRPTKSCRECSIDKFRATMSRMFYQRPMTRFELAETGRIKEVAK